MHESAQPFGNPDGSRADIEVLQRDFIPFIGSSMWGGLATKEDDLSVRVFVGRKGSGKTVYLRRLQAYASNQPSIFADQVQRDLPETQTIIKFSEWCTERNLTEQWMKVWYAAILRSLVSHLINNSKLKTYVTSNAIEKLTKDYKPLVFRSFGTPLSIYSQVTEIIESHRTPQQLHNYLNHHLWAELEYTLTV